MNTLRPSLLCQRLIPLLAIASWSTSLTAQTLPSVPPGFRAEIVATGISPTAVSDIAIVPAGFGSLGGQVLLADRANGSVFTDGQILIVDPITGTTSVFVDSAQIPDPSSLAFAPGNSFGSNLYVNNGVAPPVSQQQGELFTVDALGNASSFGQPNPLGYLWGGVDIAFDGTGAFGGDLYTGSGAGGAGDCVSRVSDLGGRALLFHNIGTGPYNGSPNGLAFGPGTGGFSSDLFIGLTLSSGIGPPSGIYVLDPTGLRTTFLLTDGVGGAPSSVGKFEFASGGAFADLLYAGSDLGVVAIDAAGQTTLFAALAGGGTINCVAFDGTDALYFVDAAQGTLFRVVQIPAEVAPYGLGCAGNNGPLTLASNLPVIGTNWNLTSSNVDSGSPIAITFFGNAVVNPGLPMLTVGFDAPGCNIYINTILASLSGNNAGGSATVTISVPNSALLAGAFLTAQSVCLTSSNNANLLTSNGLAATLGY